MNRAIKSTWRNIMFAALATVALLLAANSLTAAHDANYKVGDRIEVQFNGIWYKAEILEVKDGSYKIHYDGYGSSWDEWVTTARMRRVGAAASPASRNAAEVKTPNGAASPPVAANSTIRSSIKPTPARALPSHIVGRAVFADGSGIPQFKVSAVGFDGLAHVSTFTTAIPSLGEVEGSDGRYALRTTYDIDRSRAVSATVVGVSAETKVDYNGETFVIALHPVDGKANGTDQDHFRGHSGKGVVRDFVMKISGRKPGYEGAEDSANAFYGAQVKLDLSIGDGRTYGSELAATAPKGSVIAVTFTPDGALLDGSTGAVVTRTIQVNSRIDWHFYVQDIPLGNYTTTARMTEPDGTVRELKLSSKIGGRSKDFQSSASLKIRPFDTYFSGVKTETLYLAK